MGNREKLEIPTIEFTPVTLLAPASSTCDCIDLDCSENTETTILACKDNFH
jgi:hypothetical protein